MPPTLALILLFTAAHAGAATPELLHSTNTNRKVPMWVALSAATTPEGQLATQHFPDHALRFLQRTVAANRGSVGTDAATQQPRSCFGESPAEIFARSESLQELQSNARAVFEGEITARTVGFFEDAPGALLAVRVDRVLKSDATFTPKNEMFVYYPEADFSVGGDLYCMRPATHAARPRTGDRILVFAYLPPVDTTGRLVYTQASRHLVFETSDGCLVPPAHLRNEIAQRGITTLEGVVGQVEKSRKDSRTAGRKSESGR